jgi:hypothetical protein
MSEVQCDLCAAQAFGNRGQTSIKRNCCLSSTQFFLLDQEGHMQCLDELSSLSRVFAAALSFVLGKPLALATVMIVTNIHAPRIKTVPPQSKKMEGEKIMINKI